MNTVTMPAPVTDPPLPPGEDRLSVVDPEEAWLATAIDELYADALAPWSTRSRVPVRTTTVRRQPGRPGDEERRGGSSRLVSHSGGRQRAPP